MITKDQLAKGVKPVYTLNGDPKYIDAHELYMTVADPVEYEYAIALVGNWEHFQYLASLKWFKAHLDSWRSELEVKLRSDAIKALNSVALNDGNRGITAAKFIAEGGWKGKKRGRPSKEEIERNKRENQAIEAELGADAERVQPIH
jgi:hypothetical protein